MQQKNAALVAHYYTDAIVQELADETGGFIGESTELSRADAKKALHRGDVTCNGDVVKKSGFRVSDNIEVRLEGKLLNVRGLRYIMLNKPADYLCSFAPLLLCSNVDEVYPSVLTLIGVEKVDSLHIAGRLDADTTGLVLITDDGQWSHKFTSPGKECGKCSMTIYSKQYESGNHAKPCGTG